MGSPNFRRLGKGNILRPALFSPRSQSNREVLSPRKQAAALLVRDAAFIIFEKEPQKRPWRLDGPDGEAGDMLPPLAPGQFGKHAGQGVDVWSRSSPRSGEQRSLGSLSDVRLPSLQEGSSQAASERQPGLSPTSSAGFLVEASNAMNGSSSRDTLPKPGEEPQVSDQPEGRQGTNSTEGEYFMQPLKENRWVWRNRVPGWVPEDSCGYQSSTRPLKTIHEGS